MRMFITSKNKYLSNDMKIFGTCSIPLSYVDHCTIRQHIIKQMINVQFLQYYSTSYMFTCDEGNMEFYGSEATILADVNIVAEDP